MSDLRALIRELLSEEIAALRTEALAQSQVERVAAGSEAELTDFALNVAARAQEPGFLAALQAGRIRFAPVAAAAIPGPVSSSAAPEAPRASPPRSQPVTLVASNPVPVPELRKGLITERDIAAIAPGETRLRITKTARLTPLACDEVRRRRLRIERTLA
jgi:hypothetical protein